MRTSPGLFPLASSLLLFACQPPALPAKVDSTFKMERDSLAFPNFVTGYDGSVLDAEAMRRMFGDGVCSNGSGTPCLLTAGARSFMDDANSSMTGGRCEGFAVLSSLLEAKKLNVEDFGAATARELKLDGNLPLQRELAYWFSTQLVPGAVAEKTKKYMAKDVMPVLAESLAEGATERYRIGIVRKKGTVVSGGHTLTPIGYYRDPSAAGVYWVRVYDSNNPDTEKLLKVDTVANRWEFEAGEKNSRLYFGDDSNKNPMYFAPVFSRQGALPCPFCEEGGAQVVTQGGAQVVVDTPGGPVGLTDGEFVTSEGTSVTPGFSVEFDTEPTSLVIGVNRAQMGGMNQVVAHVTAPEDPENPEARQQIGVLNAQMRSVVSDLRVTANDTFAAAPTGARYTNNSRTDLALTTEVQRGSGSVSVTARVNGGSNEVNTELDPDAGTVRVGVGGASGSEVVVVVTSTDSNGDETSAQLTFISTGDAGLVADTSSIEDGGVLTGTVDNGGTMMTLTDACADGVRSGMESDVDCGQVCTTKCDLDRACGAPADCETGLCHATTGRCVADACADARRSNGETDVDCGGTSCAACADTKACGTDGDCASGACRMNVCVPTFALGVAVSGLPLGDAVTFANGTDSLEVRGDGSFVFPSRITGAYAVTVTTQPALGTCVVASGSGTATANVQVQVTCTPRYRLSGTVSGLASGVSVVLRNASETVTLSGDGTFVFPTAVAGAYAVTVDTQPMNQTCTVANGSGTATADVSNVTVTCSSGFTVGGAVSGLGSGKSVVLQNGTEQLTVSMSGSFTFPTPTMGAYAVSIVTQPMNQSCVLANESGTATANVTNVTVTCSDTWAVGGTMSGLGATEQAILVNGTDFLPVLANGAFTFATRVSGAYSVSVNSSPAGKQCFVVNGSGTATADVSNITVTCTTSGTLDTTFNTTGSFVSSQSAGSDLLLCAVTNVDNTIVVGGQSAVNGSDNDMVVAKLNYDGTPDTSFGTNGFVTISNGVAFEAARAVLRDQGTGYLVVGTLRGTASGNPDVGVARLTLSGALDTSFGTNGLVTHDLGGQWEYASGVTRDSSGRLLIVGRRSATGAGPHDVFVVRLNGDGSLDTTFGTGGWFTWNGGGDESGQAVSIDTVGGGDVVVLAGNGTDTFVLKLLANNGALWTGFGTGGVVTVDLSGANRNERGYGLEVVSTDLFIVGTADGASNADLVFAKLDTTGAFDATFGVGGRVLIDRGGAEVGYALTSAGSGAWYVGGHRDTSMLVARVTAGGTIDTTFSQSGFFESAFGTSALAYSLLVDVANKVVAIGTIRTSGSEDLGVARINP